MKSLLILAVGLGMSLFLACESNFADKKGSLDGGGSVEKTLPDSLPEKVAVLIPDMPQASTIATVKRALLGCQKDLRDIFILQGTKTAGIVLFRDQNWGSYRLATQSVLGNFTYVEYWDVGTSTKFAYLSSAVMNFQGVFSDYLGVNTLVTFKGGTSSPYILYFENAAEKARISVSNTSLVKYVGFASDGNIVGVFSEQNSSGSRDLLIQKWDKAGNLLNSKTVANHVVRAVAPSPDKRYLIFGKDEGVNYGDVALFDAVNFAQVAAAPFFPLVQVETVALSQNNGVAAVTTQGRELFFWERQESALTEPISFRNVAAAAFNPGGTELATLTRPFVSGSQTHVRLGFMNLQNRTECTVDLPASWLPLEGKVLLYLSDGRFVLTYDNLVVVAK